MTQTTTASGQDPAQIAAEVASVMPDGIVPPNPSDRRDPEWFYNEIMRHVQPDLMSDHLAFLEMKYAGETSYERASRMSAYELAFSAYDRFANEVTAAFSGDAARARLLRREESRKNEATQSAQDFDQITSLMDSQASA